MCASGLQGVAMRARHVRKCLIESCQGIHGQPVCATHLQGSCGIENVLGGRAPMEVAGCRLAGQPFDLFEYWHEWVLGMSDVSAQSREVRPVCPTGRHDGRNNLNWNDPEIALRLGQRRLDVQPALHRVGVAPGGDRIGLKPVAGHEGLKHATWSCAGGMLLRGSRRAAALGYSTLI